MAGRTERRQPKYLAIAADLTGKIRSGHYRPGQALPPQQELSAAYGVTLMTLRQALGRLAGDGLIVQRAGRGTFVTPAKATYGMGMLQSLSDELRAQGHEVSTVQLGRERRRVPVHVAEQLGLDRSAPALRLERLRLLGGRAAIHQLSWIPEPYAQRLREVDFTVTSLYGALSANGIVVARARERLSPGVLDARTAPVLRQPQGAPVFLSDRLTFDADGGPVVFDRATILGKYIEITTERAATSLSLRWTNAS